MQDTQESAICGGLMEPVLGSDCFAVRGIFFNRRRRGELESRLFHPLGEQQLGAQNRQNRCGFRTKKEIPMYHVPN